MQVFTNGLVFGTGEFRIRRDQGARVTLCVHQEILVRHFHKTVNDWVQDHQDRAAGATP